MRNLLLMLVSCSDRGRGLFSSMEKEKSLIISTAALDHSVNFSRVHLQSVCFHPHGVSSASVSIYKACGLTAGLPADRHIDSQWYGGLEAGVGGGRTKQTWQQHMCCHPGLNLHFGLLLNKKWVSAPKQATFEECRLRTRYFSP